MHAYVCVYAEVESEATSSSLGALSSSAAVAIVEEAEDDDWKEVGKKNRAFVTRRVNSIFL